MQIVHIENGRAARVYPVTADEAAEWSPPIGIDAVLSDVPVSVGDRYDGAAFVPDPDPNGFLLAALGALGLVHGNAVLAAWPTFTVALTARNWEVTRQVIEAAHGYGNITTQERDMLLSLLAAYHIPEA